MSARRGMTRVLAGAALAVFAGSAAGAADLGGNCCADLEERIAELEATAATKGNRKVSLEISGHINETLLIYDDGTEVDAGVFTNDNFRSIIQFRGEAKVNEDLKAGYRMEIGIRTQNSRGFTQEDRGPRGVLDLRHNYWYLASKKLGKISMGNTGGAGERATEANLTVTADVFKFSDVEDMGLGLRTRVNGNLTSTAWRQLLRGGGDQPGEGRRWNMVRYDTPTIAGFTGIWNWGEDNTWEVGLRYKGEFGDFKMAAAMAYGSNSDIVSQSPGFFCVGNNRDSSTDPAIVDTSIRDRDCHQLGGSVSVMHDPTGLYVNLAGGYLQDDLIASDPGAVAIRPFVKDRSEFYAIEAGLERKFFEVGKTTISAQYYHNEGGSQDRNFNDNGDIVETLVEAYSIGVVQGLDNAATHLYLQWRHFQADVVAGPALVNEEVDPLDVVMAGAIVRF